MQIDGFIEYYSWACLIMCKYTKCGTLGATKVRNSIMTFSSTAGDIIGQTQTDCLRACAVLNSIDE